MVVRELLSVLKFETDEAKVQSFEKSITNLTKGLALLVTGATAAATAAFGFASSTARQSEEIARSAKLASTGVEEFQKLAYASESFGIQQDKLADILKDVNDKMGDYAQTGGGAMADFFEFIAPKVGVTADQFRNLSGADALQLYVSSLEKANLSQADMTFYMEAIASDSTLLLPLLEKNGEAYKTLAKEAEDYGAILSEDNVKANKEFSKQLRSLNKMFQSVVMSVGNKLIPLFSDLVMKVKDFIARNRELIQSNISGFFDGAIWVVKQFISVLGTLFDWIDKVAQLMGGWSNAIKIVGIALGVLMALKFIPWVIAATAAIKALNLAMLLNPAGLITAAIVALGTAIVLLIEDIYQWVAGNESAIGDLLGSWEDFKNKFMGYITGAVDYVKNKFNEVSEAISGAFNSAIESVKNYFISLYDDVVNIVDKIVKVFTGLKDKVANAYENAKNGVVNGIKSGISSLLPESVVATLGLNSENSGANTTTNNTNNNTNNTNNTNNNSEYVNNNTNNTNNTNNNSEYVNNNTNNKYFTNNLTEQQKQEIYNKINLDDSLIKAIQPKSEVVTPNVSNVMGPTNNTSSVINDNKNINITVPPGTTTEQIDAIKLEINKTMQQQYTDAALNLEGY